MLYFIILQDIDEEILTKRIEFIEKIGEYDNDIAELVINESHVEIEDIKNAIKRIVVDSKALVTFCGSAYKNYGNFPLTRFFGTKKNILVKWSRRHLTNILLVFLGVQPLLDAITEFLPHPLNIKQHAFLKNLRLEKDVCAMAFKIMHHPTKAKRNGILLSRAQ